MFNDFNSHLLKPKSFLWVAKMDFTIAKTKVIVVFLARFCRFFAGFWNMPVRKRSVNAVEPSNWLESVFASCRTIVHLQNEGSIIFIRRNLQSQHNFPWTSWKAFEKHRFWWCHHRNLLTSWSWRIFYKIENAYSTLDICQALSLLDQWFRIRMGVCRTGLMIWLLILYEGLTP